MFIQCWISTPAVSTEQRPRGISLRNVLQRCAKVPCNGISTVPTAVQRYTYLLARWLCILYGTHACYLL